MIVIPLLEVMRREEHPLVPDDLSVFAHRTVEINSKTSAGISKQPKQKVYATARPPQTQLLQFLQPESSHCPSLKALALQH